MPQIYLDADEVSSPVLVLSSREIFDATHRVKVLSFVLFFISLMELLTLFGIAMGGAEDEASAVAAGYGGGGGGSGWSDGDEGGGARDPSRGSHRLRPALRAGGGRRPRCGHGGPPTGATWPSRPWACTCPPWG